MNILLRNFFIMAFVLLWLIITITRQSVFMLITIVPIIMFAIGIVTARYTALQEMPKDNSIQYFIHLGYKTGGSMRSQEAWEFANKVCGTLMIRCSIVALFGGILGILLLSFLQGSIEYAEHIMLGQLILVMVPFFMTEKEIEKTFDRQGKRK